MKKGLYEPYDPRLKHPAFFHKSFYNNSVLISLRPFFIPDDFILYNQWIGVAINQVSVSANALISEDYFDAIALSSDSQCICGLVNTVPAFVTELYPCVIHCPVELMSAIDPVPGDVLFQLFIDPSLTDQHVYGPILNTCLSYMSGFPGSQRGFLLPFEQGKEVNKYELAHYRQ
jgi:hypothetical protein